MNIEISTAGLIQFFRGERRMGLKESTRAAMETLQLKQEIMTAIAERRFQGASAGAGYTPRALDIDARAMDKIEYAADEILRRSILS